MVKHTTGNGKIHHLAMVKHTTGNGKTHHLAMVKHTTGNGKIHRLAMVKHTTSNGKIHHLAMVKHTTSNGKIHRLAMVKHPCIWIETDDPATRRTKTGKYPHVSRDRVSHNNLNLQDISQWYKTSKLLEISGQSSPVDEEEIKLKMDDGVTRFFTRFGGI